MSDSTPSPRDLFTEGLAHKDRFVRDACLDYWKEQPDHGITQSRQILNAVHAYGMHAFPYPHQAYRFPLDRAGLDQLIATLRESPVRNDRDAEDYGRWLRWCLSVDISLYPVLATWLDSVEARLMAKRGQACVSDLQQTLASMRRHESLDTEACYDAIGQTVNRLVTTDRFPSDAVADIQSLLDQLIRIEAPERLRDLASSWLARGLNTDKEEEELESGELIDDFRFGFGVYLAGRIDLTSAVDRILDGFAAIDWDWLQEITVEALAQMSPTGTTARLRDRWWALPEYGRLYCSHVFEVTHLPEHREFYLENLQREHEFELIPYQMASALAMLGDPDSLQKASEFWESNASDAEAVPLAELLHAIYRLRGEDPPVLRKMRQSMLRADARNKVALERIGHGIQPEQHVPATDEPDDLPFLRDPLPPPVPPPFPRVGRNAPCPCGSGKKYKKCCL